jgi:hypothetical protein
MVKYTKKYRRGGAPYNIFTNGINKNKVCEKEYENYDEYWKTHGYPTFDPSMTYPGKLSRLTTSRKPSKRLDGQQSCNEYNQYVALHNPSVEKLKEPVVQPPPSAKPVVQPPPFAKPVVYTAEPLNMEEWEEIPKKPTYEEELKAVEERAKLRQREFEIKQESIKKALQDLREGKKTLLNVHNLGIPNLNVFNNMEMVLAAVQGNGLELQNVPQFKNNEYIARAAYNQNKDALQYASPEIQRKIKEEELLKETENLLRTPFTRELKPEKFDLTNMGRNGGRKTKKQKKQKKQKRSKSRKPKK